MNTRTYADAIDDCLIKLGEAFQVFIDAVREQWEPIKEFIEQHLNDDYLYLDDKPDWFTPKNILLKSQVLNRKPMLARARSNC